MTLVRVYMRVPENQAWEVGNSFEQIEGSHRVRHTIMPKDILGFLTNSMPVDIEVRNIDDLESAITPNTQEEDNSKGLRGVQGVAVGVAVAVAAEYLKPLWDLAVSWLPQAPGVAPEEPKVVTNYVALTAGVSVALLAGAAIAYKFLKGGRR